SAELRWFGRLGGGIFLRMPTQSTPATRPDSWPADQAVEADPLDGLIHLSHLLGNDIRLVQPGGGNTSIKLTLPADPGGPVEALVVKGSGTDLRTIGREGFTWLGLSRLTALRQAESMSDAERRRFMAGCEAECSTRSRTAPSAWRWRTTGWWPGAETRGSVTPAC